MVDEIIVKGAREHNLKNVSLVIPKNKLVVFTGVSGSGKSSMAFDTIYAEGQRRYIESLASYARQFLGSLDKPDVDMIEGLSPAISIDQKSSSHNPRSTVGTTTEVYDYLRLLFARVGHPHCHVCGREISKQTAEEITDQIIKLAKNEGGKAGRRVLILSPVVKDQKGEHSKLLKNLKAQGFSRARIDGRVRSLEEDLILIKTNKHKIEAVCDRLVIPTKGGDKYKDVRSRVFGSVEQALKISGGEVVVSFVKDKGFDFPQDPKIQEDHLFSERFACPVDNISLPELEPRNFSFNSPHGACADCTGLGFNLKVSSDFILNPKLSVNEGGVLPLSRLTTKDTWFTRLLKSVASSEGFSLDAPIGDLSKTSRNILLYGGGEKLYEVSGTNRFGRFRVFSERFDGLVPYLERRYEDTESDYVRGEIEKYMVKQPCPTCNGDRLGKQALAVIVAGKNIIEVTKVPINDTLSWVRGLHKSLNKRELKIADPIVREIESRLTFLVSVGLDYLSLDRASATLAGGEAQRIRLASQIGSGLSGVLYVLDEPSIGLHARDQGRLIETLVNLRNLGNTVIVVEHDPQTIKASDWIVDFGPGAGEHGGFVVFEGTLKGILKSKNSLTGQYLSGRKKIEVLTRKPAEGKTPGVFIRQPQGLSNSAGAEENLTILGCREHNLKNIDVSFPLGKFNVVTGVSGSGKSTLVNETLYRSLRECFGLKQMERPGKHGGILGTENVSRVINIDQSPIGRTPRSNPATYTKSFDYIRDIFSKTPEARIRGYAPGRFSFNVKGGRCEACLGEGQVKIEMQFLPDVYVDCEVCRGSRYNFEALEIEYKEKNIADVLDMSVEEALEFFQNIPQIRRKLETLYDVGLGYIKLGQPAPTLSGGEAQRVKLASELSKKSSGSTLYLLDEPTTGLHFDDLKKLIIVLRRLVDQGNTVIVIEHNLDVIKNADWVIDLGPEGGNGGGEVIYAGNVSGLLRSSGWTAQMLKSIL